MKGTCLCRRVSVTVAEAPSYINICNCDFCRRLGAAWGFYTSDQVQIDGETQGYRREDFADPDDVWLEARACPTCSTTTHYVSIKPGHDKIGINTRIFAQDELTGIAVRYQDGREVTDETDEFICTANGTIGDGRAF